MPFACEGSTLGKIGSVHENSLKDFIICEVVIGGTEGRFQSVYRIGIANPCSHTTTRLQPVQKRSYAVFLSSFLVACQCTEPSAIQQQIPNPFTSISVPASIVIVLFSLKPCLQGFFCFWGGGGGGGGVSNYDTFSSTRYETLMNFKWDYLLTQSSILPYQRSLQKKLTLLISIGLSLSMLGEGYLDYTRFLNNALLSYGMYDLYVFCL